MMNRRDHDKLMKPLCKQLNALIPIKDTEDRDKINALIYEVSQIVPDRWRSRKSSTSLRTTSANGVRNMRARKR